MTNNQQVLVIPRVKAGREIFSLRQLEDEGGQFQRFAAVVQREWRARQVMSERGAAIKWMRPICYRWVVHLLDTDSVDILRDMVINAKRGRHGQAISTNPFSIALLALWARNKPSEGPTEKQREAMGVSLWQAYRHYIPDVLLAGFLHQLGEPRLRELGASKEAIEPSFKEWIIQQRALSSLTEISCERGPYPHPIDKGVQKLIKKLRRSD
jgi:hypothetical protein